MSNTGHFDADELEILKNEYYKPLKEDFMSNRLKGENGIRKRFNGEYQRDYTRIMYSSSFRRLQGKMQLLGIRTDQFFRNRLTHSLEVAQIARSLAEEIEYGIDDIYVVEAGALAHDIGNAPFGHYGEKVLNELSKEVGGFEGNAQTLRVLMEKEKKKAEFNGLNLTLRTLLSVVKYFKKYENSMNEKFIYDESFDILKEKIDEHEIKIRTLDVQIVDIADEVAYAAHDLEDALKLNCLTIEELLFEFELQKEKYPGAIEALIGIVCYAKQEADKAKIYQSSEEYSQIFRKELTSKIINTLISDIHLMPINTKNKTGTQWDRELNFRTYSSLAKGLKKITFKCISKSDNVYFYEQQGKKVIEGLYNVFINYPKYLPIEYRPDENIRKVYGDGAYENHHQRLVLDYIAGMMDSFAINTYKKFYGSNSLERMYSFESQ